MVASDEEIRDFLITPKKIAIVGASSKPDRTSNEISRFLMEKGHKIVPIHPMEKEILGEPVVKSLDELEEEVDGVIIYLNPRNVYKQIEKAVEKGIPMIWLPLEVTSEEGKALVESKGLKYVENKCPKIEWPKLIG